MKKIKLFCLPHSGGSVTTFQPWKNYIDRSFIDLHPLELPGRGKRFKEKLCRTMPEVVEDTYNRIKESIEDDSYAFFGHSLGSLLALELAHHIRKENKKSPVHIFFSGHAPNDIEDKACFSKESFKRFIEESNLNETLLLDTINYETVDNKKCFLRSEIEKIKSSHPEIYRALFIKCSLPPDISDEEFIKESIEVREANREILENSELKDLFLPILRADGGICFSYKWTPEPSKLQCDITALYGLDEEDITTPDIEHWKTHTEKSCKIIPFKGDHFFIEDNLRSVVAIINQTLSKYQ